MFLVLTLLDKQIDVGHICELQKAETKIKQKLQQCNKTNMMKSIFQAFNIVFIIQHSQVVLENQAIKMIYF